MENEREFAVTTKDGTYYFSMWTGTRMVRRSLGVKASTGVYIEDGFPVGEDPKVFKAVITAHHKMYEKLTHEGALAAAGGMKYAAAMQMYIEWRAESRNNPQFEGHAKLSVARFGDMRLPGIQWQHVHDWIRDDLVPVYADNTIKHKVGAGKFMYNWLRRTGQYRGDNPFTGHEWKARRPGLYIKSTISEEEWYVVKKIASGQSQAALQAVCFGYYTGLRPSEIYRIRPEDIDRESGILRVRVQKTGTVQRYIAIPASLTAALDAPVLTLTKANVTHHMERLRAKHPALVGLCMESFRRNYAAVMEAAGCPLDSIDAHQGRNQKSRVITRHYLQGKDRAVNLMRPWMRVFDGAEPERMVVVK